MACGTKWVTILLSVALLSGCGDDVAVTGFTADLDVIQTNSDGLTTDSNGSDTAAADLVATADATADAPADAVDSNSAADTTVCKTSTDCPASSSPCVVFSCSEIGQCLAQNVVGPCEDGNACTAGDSCAQGVCLAGAATACDDQNPCTSDSCDAKNGCAHAANAAPCDDANACTVGDACAAGVCEPGAAFVCQDGNPCTADSCNPANGCAYFPEDGAPCDDGDACTLGDTCLAKACVSGAVSNCDDANPCTVDSCDKTKGCVHDAASGPCSDGSACTVADQCASGGCAAGSALSCDDNNPCTLDGCEAIAGCTHLAASATCTDANACTGGESCADGNCKGGQPINCDDKNPCTTDSCDASTGCAHQDNQFACDDNNPCTQGDACGNGTCQSGTNTCACKIDADCGPPSANLCAGQLTCQTVSPGKTVCAIDAKTIVKCDTSADTACSAASCDPGDGQCKLSAVNGAKSCDDGNICSTGDACQDGSCVGTKMLACGDGNPCTDDSCDKIKGCVFVANVGACSDGNVCTVGDNCQAGACLPGAASSCDDNNVCTSDSCDPKQGCVPVPNSLPCSDGNVCTTGDTCNSGGCQSGAAAVCADGNPCTDDGCDPLKGCQFANNTVSCTDSNVCTSGDACKAGVCLPGAVSNCDDANACTLDSCDAQKGCQNKAVAVPCDDGTVCTLGDVCVAGSCKAGVSLSCDDNNACTDDTCDSALGCSHKVNTAPCNDNNACTGPDVCNLGQCKSNAIVCNDANLCTDDYCDSAKGCQTINNIAVCSDNNACTQADGCSAGKCLGVQVNCSDNNPCTADTCNIASGCSSVALANATPCGKSGICQAGVCSLGSDLNPALSCKAILAAVPGTKSGIYYLDPDGAAGPGLPFANYCDQENDGGGWTLLLKIDGNATTFGLASSQWFVPTGYKPDSTALDKDEAKMPSYGTVPFTQLRLGMDDGQFLNYMKVSYVGTSLYDVIKDGAFKATSAGRDAWKSLIVGSSLQLNCNQEGFNTLDCRIGIVNNQENDCLSPDSWLGFGCNTVTVGNWANGQWQPDNGGKNYATFGYVFAR